MAKLETVTVKDRGGAEIHNMINVDGLRLSTFGESAEEVANIVHNLVELAIREDDVMLCSAPKSGTHWTFEIVSMLLNGKPETIPYSKGALMVEVIPPSSLENLPSPRVLNSHLPLRMLPKELKDKKTKIVLCLRNPKDVAVSYYHHHRGLQFFDYEGKFDDYLPVFMAGEVDYDDWFNYVLEMERIMDSGEYNIHLVYYEDLKENGYEEIRKIAKFMGLPDKDELCRAIAEKCVFKNMAVDKAYTQEDAFKGNYSFFRRGEVGDWKNYFTVAMSEEFDKVFNERMKHSKLKFRFALDAAH